MTVKELLEQLVHAHPNAKVQIGFDGGTCCSDAKSVEIAPASANPLPDEKDGIVYISDE